MSEKTYNLPIECPVCRKERGLRIVDDGNEVRAICVKCEGVDESVGTEELVETIIAIAQASKDSGGLTHDELSDILCEKFDLPEADEDEEKEE